MKFKRDALEEIGNFIQGQRTVNEQIDWVQTGVVVLLEILRALAGDEYYKGFLRGALDAKEPLFKTEQQKIH